jgi:prolyl-tRNA synthetase
MTRLSTYLLPTEKQAPADAEALSHKLLVRAGMARQLGAGLWTFLPAGWRVHRRVEQIIREELDAIGGQELLMPVMHPAELWQRTGRYDIDELFKLKDRRGADLVLAMTHEEVVTWHVSQLVRSYRELPMILYHLQTKERDEPRPRAGLLRTREFIMKDAYSFDVDVEGLDAAYEKHRGAYARIFDRAGLDWYEVESDVGMMGGLGAHEYMAPCAAGENEVALAPGYAANVEVAAADPQPVELPPSTPEPREVPTPGLTTIAEVAARLELPEGACLKAFPVVSDGRGLLLVLLRGDHRVNEIKLANALGEGFRQAHPDEIASRIGPPGFIGPVGADVPVLIDDAVEPGGAYVTGANREGHHLTGVEPGRDFPFKRADVRRVEAGDTVGGRPVRLEPAIEVGNIFKLGTRYSEPLNATVLDEEGRARTIVMGSYGIGPARIMAAAVEQFADEHGIS